MGVFAQISEHASFHLCAVKCRRECVVCVVHPAVSSLLFAAIQASENKMATANDMFLPVIYCMLKLCT